MVTRTSLSFISGSKASRRLEITFIVSSSSHVVYIVAEADLAE